MSNDVFWKQVDDCLDEIKAIGTVDGVIEVLNRYFAEEWAQSCAGDAFFPGSGGDRQLLSALGSGWTVEWAEARYYYLARDREGGLLTYIEGDVYRGDRRSPSATDTVGIEGR